MKKTSLWSKPALKVRIVFILLLGLGSVQLGAEVSEAADFLRKHDVAFDLFVNDRFHAFHNFHDTGNSEFNHDRSLHVLYVNPAVSIRLAPGLLGFFELESQFIYDFDDEESADDQETRNAYLKALVPGMNWMTISAGRQSLSTLDGFIYDGEAPAFRLQADFERGLGLPLKLDSVIAGVERDSPYLQADLTYNYAFLESLTFSYGWFRDTDDGIAVIFNELDSETSYRSRSQFHWFGASLKMFLDDFFLRTSFVYERGTIRLREGDPGSRSMAVHAYLADVNLDYYFTSHLWFSFFVFVASGDDRPLQGTLRSFISIDPFIDKTSIFFNGGFDSRFSSDNVGLTGIQTPGVIAPGMLFEYRTKTVSCKAVLAYLATHRGTHAKGTTYGYEVDLLGTYALRDNLQFFAELDFFFPGDYFRELSKGKEHTAIELIIGINYLFAY